MPSLHLHRTDYGFFSLNCRKEDTSKSTSTHGCKKKEAWTLGFSTPQASKKFRGNGTSMLTLQEQDLDEP